MLTCVGIEEEAKKYVSRITNVLKLEKYAGIKIGVSSDVNKLRDYTAKIVIMMSTDVITLEGEDVLIPNTCVLKDVLLIFPSGLVSLRPLRGYLDWCKRGKKGVPFYADGSTLDSAKQRLVVARSLVRKLAGEINLEECLMKKTLLQESVSRGNIVLTGCHPSVQKPDCRYYTVPTPGSVHKIFPRVNSIPCQMTAETLSVFLPISLKLPVATSVQRRGTWFRYEINFPEALVNYPDFRVGPLTETLLATTLRGFTKEVDAALSVTL